jgi:hypothetical protein
VRDWRFWALLGPFALLTALSLALPRLDADQAITGLMGMHILRGEFPIFFWRQNHAGVPESYGAAVTFALLGPSRVALNLVPSLSALGLLLVLHRTGHALFGREAGLLAMLFATIVSPYVASHYVLARGYYVEHLLLGGLVLLGAALWLARALTEPARSRVLIVMGLAGGVGLYCGFQIVAALVPAGLALLFVDPRLPLRRGFWLGVGAFAAGSAPFWAYNLTHDWATFATGARFRGGHSAGEATWLLLADHLPVVLGVKEYVGSPPYLPGPLAWIPPLVAGAAVALLLGRAVLAGGRLRRDPARAGEALLVLALAVVLGVVWAGRYVQVPRYVLPVAPILALVLARACQLVWRWSRVGTALAVVAYLGAVGAGLASDLAVLWPSARAAYWRGQADDAALFALLRERGLTQVYAYDYWLAPRLTFDAAESILVAEPFRDRHPAYTRAVDASRRVAYVSRGRLESFERWMEASGIAARRSDVGAYSVYWSFTPPPAGRPLPRAEWTVTATAGHGEPAHLIDGRLESGWASAGGPGGSARIVVDLGLPQPVAGVTLVTDHPRRLPHTLDVSLDGKRAVRVETGGFTVAWRNDAPRTVPGHTLTVRFAPAEARHVTLTDLGPGGAWAVAELFVLAPSEALSGTPADARVADGERLEAAGAVGPAFARYREVMRAHPDDPAGYTGFARLAAEVGLHQPGPPAAQAARYARFGLTDRARALYAHVAGRLPGGVTHAELAERLAALAASEGDATEAARLRAEVEAARRASRPVGATFGRLVALTGYDAPARPVRPGETLVLTYHWRLLGSSRELVFAYTHLRGERYRFSDDRPVPRPIPGLGNGPQHVVEARGVVVPPDAPPGRYQVVLGVWEPEARRHLRRWWAGLVPTSRETVELEPIEVLPR